MKIRQHLEDILTGETNVLLYDDDPDQGKVKWRLEKEEGEIPRKLEAFLTTPQIYLEPNGEYMDQNKEVKAMPTDNVGYFEQGLCELMSVVNVALRNYEQVKE